MKYGVVEGSLTQLLPNSIERIRFFDSLALAQNDIRESDKL